MQTTKIIFNVSGETPDIGHFTKDEERELAASIADIFIVRGIARPASSPHPPAKGDKKKNKEEVEDNG